MIKLIVGYKIWFWGLVSQLGSINVFALIGIYLGVCAIGYLLGSLNTAIIVSRLMYKDDIRKHGSGNAGMTNMMRTYGKGPAAITFVGDLLKTLIAMAVGTLIIGVNGAYFAGLFAILGHIAPLYYSFKGGKGVAAGGMFILYLEPTAFLVVVAIFVLVVWGLKYLSLGSIISAFVFPIIMFRLNEYKAVEFLERYPEELNPYLTDRPLHLGITLLIAFIVIFMHRGNIKRLAEGKESKFRFKKTQKPAEAVAAEPIKAAPRSLHNIDADDEDIDGDGTDGEVDDLDDGDETEKADEADQSSHA